MTSTPATGKPGRRRWPVAALGLGALLVVGYAALLLAVPLVPRLHYARVGLRLEHCQFPGGSIPVDFPGMVRVHPEVELRQLRSIEAAGHLVVAADAVTADGGVLGTATWVADHRFGAPERPVVALNDTARAVADNPDGRDGSAAWGAEAAAIRCRRS